jgi:Flp pilus assembly protein TadG
VAVTTALFLGGLFGFFALAFNVGLMMDSRTELQNASDSAALAAARSLNGTASGLTAARKSAYDFSMKHTTYGVPITIDTGSADLTFGRWHLSAAECLFGSSGHDCFESISTTEPRKITAVKIRNGRDGGSHNAPLELVFGSFVGSTTANVRSAAVAVGGGPAAPSCVLPLAVAECSIVNSSTGQMNCASGPQQMVFSNANVDAVGFANLFYPDDRQSPNGTFVADVINSKMCNPDNYKTGCPARRR